MTREQIDTLILPKENLTGRTIRELIETHISWVLLTDHFAYKIKKPICYSFLDFSSIDKRQYFCKREVELNQRLSNIYLDVLPIREIDHHLQLGGENGKIIDYSVRMKRLDTDKQMNVMLINDEVKDGDIKRIAEKLASFHKRTNSISQKDLLDIANKFKDLDGESRFLEESTSELPSAAMIDYAITISNQFMEENMKLLEWRLSKGMFRDCHGDLHSRNIFLLPSPELFDCIEFNDDYRHIDVLNEVAFLCMDLDSFGRNDLSDLFLTYYNRLFPVVKTSSDYLLFIYYKSYRSNIRVKVNSLRAKNTEEGPERNKALFEAKKYLQLMDSYVRILDKALNRSG
jgi:uncharacterized protein